MLAQFWGRKIQPKKATSRSQNTPDRRSVNGNDPMRGIPTPPGHSTQRQAVLTRILRNRALSLGGKGLLEGIFTVCFSLVAARGIYGHRLAGSKSGNDWDFFTSGREKNCRLTMDFLCCCGTTHKTRTSWCLASFLLKMFSLKRFTGDDSLSVEPFEYAGVGLVVKKC